MASPVLLLTPEQAHRNHQVFMRVAANLPRPLASKHVLPRCPSLKDSAPLGRPLGSAAADVTTGTNYPPPPNISTWQNPKYHDQVISTFFSTAQSQVGYQPNKVGDTPQQQIDGFNQFIAQLQYYGAYLPLVDSKENKYSNSSTECGPLLNAAKDFVKLVADAMSAASAQKISDDLINLIQGAVTAMGSSSSESVETTQYSFYVVEGNVSDNTNPIGIIFYSFVDMERHTSGKSTVSKQTIEMYSYSYRINSAVVVENAEALSTATIVPSKAYASSINSGLP